MTENLENIIKEREKKLTKIKNFGFSPFPILSYRNFEIKKAIKNFGILSKKQTEIIIAGRIRGKRVHGAITFCDIEDATEKIQAVFKEDTLGKRGYEFFLENFDIGDIIEIKGTIFKTKVGEKSILVSNYKMLAKSLLPLPEKWHGIEDIETRFRKRYLDLIFNPKIRKNFEIRSKIIQEIRNFLYKEGFLEVETPILQPLYGGARAKPFKTHLNSLNIDLYLRISPELYLKRLLIGGFEKVFEIGKCFRNEGIDKFHNPDFTMLEFYWAYSDYKKLMKFTEKMLSSLIKKIFKKTKIVFQEKEINFKAPWQRIEFDALFQKELNINYDVISREALFAKAKDLGLEIEENLPKYEIADEIFKKIIRPKILQPTFIIHYPLGFQVLAKSLEDNPKRLANFQLIVAGIEIINAFSELNDPLEQKRRFEEQEEILNKTGFSEIQRKDDDFLEALSYGMPPAAGFGMGIDRLVMLILNANNLREIILFPTMRPK
ncbi:MAG: lysine--tRNA ligase [Minisyncoccia bacterium]